MARFGTSTEPLATNEPVAISREPHVPRWNTVPPRLSPGIPENETPSHCDSFPTAPGASVTTRRPFHGVIASAERIEPVEIELQSSPSQRASPLYADAPTWMLPQAKSVTPSEARDLMLRVSRVEPTGCQAPSPSFHAATGWPDTVEPPSMSVPAWVVRHVGVLGSPAPSADHVEPSNSAMWFAGMPFTAVNRPPTTSLLPNA